MISRRTEGEARLRARASSDRSRDVHVPVMLHGVHEGGLDLGDHGRRVTPRAHARQLIARRSLLQEGNGEEVASDRGPPRAARQRHGRFPRFPSTESLPRCRQPPGMRQHQFARWYARTIPSPEHSSAHASAPERPALQARIIVRNSRSSECPEARLPSCADLSRVRSG